jgi:hypothetical protein
MALRRLPRRALFASEAPASLSATQCPTPTPVTTLSPGAAAIPYPPPPTSAPRVVGAVQRSLQDLALDPAAFAPAAYGLPEPNSAPPPRCQQLLLHVVGECLLRAGLGILPLRQAAAASLLLVDLADEAAASSSAKATTALLDAWLCLPRNSQLVAKDQDLVQEALGSLRNGSVAVVLCAAMTDSMAAACLLLAPAISAAELASPAPALPATVPTLLLHSLAGTSLGVLGGKRGGVGGSGPELCCSEPPPPFAPSPLRDLLCQLLLPSRPLVDARAWGCCSGLTRNFGAAGRGCTVALGDLRSGVPAGGC